MKRRLPDPDRDLPEWLRDARRKKKEQRNWRGHLYYRTYPNFSIAPAEDALYADRINRAIKSSVTWGDFRTAVPKEYDWLFADCEDNGGDQPADTDPFNPQMIPVGDGDYPPWLLRQALNWLPAAAISECLEIGVSMVSGPCPDVAANKIDRLKQILESEGYRLEFRPDLEFN